MRRWLFFWRYCGCGHLNSSHYRSHVQSSPWGANGDLHTCYVCECVKAT